MSFSVGIVGLPNAGKSTLFNALVKGHQAKVASHPFTTINPNVGIVEVPDTILDKIVDTLKLPKKIPATIKFVDIAGLVKNAHLGEGLGNQFLSHIKEVDAIVHIVRVFDDPNVPHVHQKIDPQYDIDIVNLELELVEIKKPTIYLYNVSEKDLKKPAEGNSALYICAKLESELVDLPKSERQEYLDSIGIQESILDTLIKRAYHLLNLITFYTLKPDQTRLPAPSAAGYGGQVQAWPLIKETKAQEAAGKVHSDMERGFIAAEVVSYNQLLSTGSLETAKTQGLIRTEGKNYIIQDKDVVRFKFNV